MTTNPSHDSAAIQRASSFVRLLAHELRNYIAPMHNALHLLRLKAKGDPTLPPVIDLMERQLKNMLGALEAVGDADRLRRGDMALERAPADLSQIVDEALRTLPVATAAQARRVDIDVQDGLPKLDVDASRLARALAAIVDNALRYSPGDSAVHVRAHRADDAIELTVDDRGPGMPAELREHVTQFFAVPHQAGHGLGLGLPIAAAIVALHGGTLSVTETGTGGTRVRLCLPQSMRDDPRAQQDDATATAAVPPAVAGAGKSGRRVLIADDSPAVRASLADLLEEMGHEVKAAADGAEAVALAQAWRPEFVLLDIHMPKLSGFDAARKLRAQFPPSTMQLVMMSGENLDEVIRRGAREAGFDHCIDKGLAIGELTGLLSR